MSREKQIEGMAEILRKVCEPSLLDECDSKNCNECMAEAIYNAGYRKQSEGEWAGTHNLRHCSKCGNVVNFNNVSSWLYNYCPNCGARMGGGAE